MLVLAVVVARLSANRMAKEGYTGKVRCQKCDYTARVDPFYCFRFGWPKHCGETVVSVKDGAP